MDGIGLNDSARRRMVTDDMNCPIAIDSILWIGIEPDENGTVAHNYVVASAPQKSLNHIVYIVEAVNVGVTAENDIITPLPTPFDPGGRIDA